MQGLFKYKFLRSSFIISLVVVLLLPLYTIFVTFPEFTRLLVLQSEMSAQRVGGHLASYLDDIPLHASGAEVFPEAFQKEMARVMESFYLLKYRVFSRQGEIVLSSAQGEAGKVNDHDYFREVVARGNPYTKTVKKDQPTLENETTKIDVVESYVPIMKNGRFIGAFEIYFDVTREMDELSRAVWRSSLVLFAVAVGFFIFMLFIRHTVVRPISLVSTAMNGMVRGDLEQRIPVLGDDELSQMAQTFNQMCEELKRSTSGLKSEQEKLTTILLSSREGIVVTHKGGEVALVNPAAERLLGKDEGRIKNEGFLKLLDDPDYLDALLHRGAGLPETVVYNDHVLHVYAAVIRQDNGNEIGKATLLRDITDQHRLESELRKLSNTDGLTGLNNRRRADTILNEELERVRRYPLELAVLLFDVDHFKRFNDEFGHDQGDRVLQALAAVMKDHFRAVDFCCRFGGEEFLVIMPNTGLPGALLAAERFRQRVASLEVDGKRVTVSIGVAIFPQEGERRETAEMVVKRADDALYQAKHQGRNQVVCLAAGEALEAVSELA